MKRLILLVVVAGLGVSAAIALAGTGPTQVCATTPAHTVAVDGSPVSTTPGDVECASIPTVTETVTVTGQTTTGTTTPAPAPTVLFDDEFNGAAGAGLDPSKWVTFGNVCPTSSNWKESCIRKSNAFQNGSGDLVLRVTCVKDSAGNCAATGTQGRPYDGAEISPDFLSGYPPSRNPSSLYKYPAGTRLEARIKFAPGAGLWETFWSVSPDTDKANYLELDTQEFRGDLPFNDTCHAHGILEYGATLNQGFTGWSDWHVYWQNYYADHVTWGVDSKTCGSTSIPADPKESPILWNMVGPPGAWGGTGGPPPASDIPADMLVDYVRVTQLG